MKCTWLVHPYEWRSGTSDGLFLPIYPPRSMRIVLSFWWLVDFCNKYVSSLWLMLSPLITRTLTLPSLLASSVPCIALSHIESWRKLRRCIQTRDMIHSFTHKPPYIFLKTATISTYYGISIAIPRYIAMQLFHHHHIHDLSIHCHIALHGRKIASMMFSWLVLFLMSLLC